MPASIRFTLTLREFSEGLFWALQTALRPLFLVYLASFPVLIAILACFRLVPLAFALVALLIPLSGAANVWIAFLKRPEKDAECTWSVTDDALVVSFRGQEERYGWRDFGAIFVTGRGLVLRPNKGAFVFLPGKMRFHWLPRHGIQSADDFARISRWAQEAVGLVGPGA